MTDADLPASHGRMPDERRKRSTEIIDQPEQEVKLPPLFRVLLHNDDYTTMEFVIQVLESVFLMHPAVHLHHHPVRFGRVHQKDRLEYLDDELHRRVVVVVEQHPEEGRQLHLLLGLVDDLSAALAAFVWHPAMRRRQVCVRHPPSSSVILFGASTFSISLRATQR